ADLSAAVQNALQTLLPQIRAEIREEFHTSSGPSDAGGNHPPVTIHTWFERCNKQKPHSFEKAIAPKSGDRHQPTSQQSSHRNHDHNNDRHGSDRRGGSDNHRSSNNNYSGRISVMGVTRETGVSSPTDLPILVLSSPGVPLRATLTQFALLVDVDTQ
nr:hypothetical protein [Tanacetum cinerariifolium]